MNFDILWEITEKANAGDFEGNCVICFSLRNFPLVTGGGFFNDQLKQSIIELASRDSSDLVFICFQGKFQRFEYSLLGYIGGKYNTNIRK
jgi:hypothetical protein